MAIEKAYLEKQLSATQKQAVIKLIEKKGREKYIQNWQPISLLNVDVKLISKALQMSYPKKYLQIKMQFWKIYV